MHNEAGCPRGIRLRATHDSVQRLHNEYCSLMVAGPDMKSGSHKFWHVKVLCVLCFFELNTATTPRHAAAMCQMFGGRARV